MSTNKNIFSLFHIVFYYLYIFTYQLFITRLFVIFPLLFLGAFLFSSNKKLATKVANFYYLSILIER